MNEPTIYLTIFLTCIVFIVPKHFILFPFIMAASMVPMNQRIIIFDIDFTLLRILILFCTIRISIKQEKENIQWNEFDKLILTVNIVESVVYIIQWRSFSQFLYKCGALYDCLGMYWLFRQTIRNWRDVKQLIAIFSVFAIISAPLVAMENIKQYSFYSIFGPVGAKFHRGRFRCAGPFPHYIMMGCYWAILLPLIYAGLKTSRNKSFYLLAITGSLICIYYSASSTPMLGVVSIVFFWMLYKYRIHGMTFLKLICFSLLILHLIMKKPVWHLMSRVGVFGGSTGYHRYFLFDQFIKHTLEWFFLGTRSTRHWGYQLFDVTNQFVLEAVRGGIATLILFIVIVYKSVKIPGSLSITEKDQDVKWLAWAICVTMLGHFVQFWGVSYFGQINMILYLGFALVGWSLEHINRTSLLTNTERKYAAYEL